MNTRQVSILAMAEVLSSIVMENGTFRNLTKENGTKALDALAAFRTGATLTIPLNLEASQRLALDVPLRIEVRQAGASPDAPALYLESLLPRTAILRIVEEIAADCQKNDEPDRVLFVLGVLRSRFLKEMGG